MHYILTCFHKRKLTDNILNILPFPACWQYIPIHKLDHSNLTEDCSNPCECRYCSNQHWGSPQTNESLGGVSDNCQFLKIVMQIGGIHQILTFITINSGDTKCYRPIAYSCNNLRHTCLNIFKTMTCSNLEVDPPNVLNDPYNVPRF